MHILKAFKLTAAAITTTLFPLLSNPALSTPVLINEPACYMKNADSTIIDLTDLCNKPSAAPNTTNLNYSRNPTTPVLAPESTNLTNHSRNSTTPVATPNTRSTIGDFGQSRTTPKNSAATRSDPSVVIGTEYSSPSRN